VRRIICCLLVACAAVASCRRDTPDETETAAPVDVAVVAARTGSIRAVTTVAGSVTPAPGAELLVTAPEAARIAQLPKGEGDPVAPGDLLVRFDIPSLAAQAEAARATINQAQARVDNARAASTRVAGLFERGIAARKEVEDADRELREAEAALEQARSASGAATALEQRTTVRATFPGVVAKRWHNVGDMVEPGASDPILRVLNPSRLEVTASIPATDVGHILAGAPATVTDPGTGDARPAVVLTRPAAVDPATSGAPIRLRLTGATSNVAAGMPVQVQILGTEHPQSILVPPAAVMHEEGESYVMIAGGDGKAHRKAVEVGIVTSDAAEIRSGVSAGERVIVRGQNGLPDGASISISS
jgi:RND family efflux transporter MFP subunit